MDEKNEQDIEEYTGEYGNMIQRVREASSEAKKTGAQVVNNSSSAGEPGASEAETDGSGIESAISREGTNASGIESAASGVETDASGIEPAGSGEATNASGTESSVAIEANNSLTGVSTGEVSPSVGENGPSGAETSNSLTGILPGESSPSAGESGTSGAEMSRSAGESAASGVETDASGIESAASGVEANASEKGDSSVVIPVFLKDIDTVGTNASEKDASSGSEGIPPIYYTGAANQSYYRENRESSTAKGEPAEKKSGFGRKLLLCACAAVIFGVVAAACFQGVCYFSDKVLGVNLTAANAKINHTTEGVHYTYAATDTAIGTADVSGIVQQSMPAIVSITSTSKGEGSYDLFGQYYEGQDTVSAGTGFIVGKNDKELLIATNNHVVEDAKAISVQLIDEEVYSATTKGTDASADLAVIAIPLKAIKSSSLKAIRIATLGDSTECKVGEMVVAIGNSLGYGQSVTVGYVSARDREISAGEQGRSRGDSAAKMKVIQTDAAINPGNSGGPLINMKGEVIGINSAKIAASAVEGVGYSIPISEADPIIDELMNREVLTEAEKGYLGIAGKTVSEEASNFNMPEGVYVEDVAKDGAAGKAGVQKGDIITAINGIKVTTIESLKDKANSYKKGTTVTLTLKRSDDGVYREKKLEVVLQGKSSLKDLDDGLNNQRGQNGADSGNNGDSGNGSDSENGNGSGDENGFDNGDNGSDGGSYGNGDDDGQNGGNNDFWGDFFPFGW